MVRFVCPSCGAPPETTEEWLRVRSARIDEAPPTIQLLLDENPQPEESSVTEEGMKAMRTLRPCGHTFPDTSMTTVLTLLDILETLLERHDDTTTPLETQYLRREIHTVGQRLDAVVQQCTDQAELNNSVRCQQWRSDERGLETWS